MPTILSNITLKQARGEFFDAMEVRSPIWPNHCQSVTSDAATETYAFPGHVPVPRQFAGSRVFQDMRDFVFTLTNRGYELSVVIDRDTLADDRHGQLMQRFRMLGESYSTFKDALFVQLLLDGDVAGNVAFDGVTFYNDNTRVIGASATIDNLSTSAAATGTIPTNAELLSALEGIIGLMMRFQDDQGRPMMTAAHRKLRVVIPPSYERSFAEATRSTLISNTDNVYGRGLVEFDSTPYLTGDTQMFVNAVGGTVRPFIHQQREPLEIVFFNDEQSIADNHGLKVLCWERFRFGYGDPRYSTQHTFS